MDKAQQQMEEFRILMEHLESGGLLGDGTLQQGPVSMDQPEPEPRVAPSYLAAPSYLSAPTRNLNRTAPIRENETVVGPSVSLTPEQRFNPNVVPEGGRDNWFYTTTTGWQFKGRGPQGQRSSYVNNQGQRVMFDNVAISSKFDEELVSARRQAITGRNAWMKGADQSVGAGMLYNKQTNPFTYSEEEKQRQLDNYASAMAKYERDVAEQGGDTGWLIKPKKPVFNEDAAYSGRSRFVNPASRDPFINVFEADIDGVISNLQSAEYNPFYDYNDTPGVRARRAAMGLDDSKSAYANRREGNAMDWLFEASKKMPVANRRAMLQNFDNYVDKYGRAGLYRRKMDQRLFDQMNMGSVLGEYDGTGGGLGDLFAKGNPLKANGQPIEAKPGGFLEAYAEKKADLKKRPSVMSLMQEMKDFK